MTVARDQMMSTNNNNNKKKNKIRDNSHDARWREMYDRLVAYKKKHNSTCVPQSYPADVQLPAWVYEQRKRYNKLTADRISQLDSIGFVWNPFRKWTEQYERLVVYKEQHNSTCVPRPYEADPQLGRWVQTQRSYYKKNSLHLTTKRKHQLNSIDFVWNAHDAKWIEMYERLVDYKKQNKTTCVPYSYPADPQLGGWVHTQRSYYNTSNSYLTADRMSRLNSIGFVWKMRTNNVYL